MSLATITTMGYEVGTVNLVVTLGYGQGAAPPPPPPVVPVSTRYGPALWDYGELEDRRKRKRDLERQKRIEAGVIRELIVPKELKAEVREVVKEAVKEALVPYRLYKEYDYTPLVGVLAKQVASELALELKDARKLERKRIEEDEEDEAIEAITIWMMN